MAVGQSEQLQPFQAAGIVDAVNGDSRPPLKEHIARIGWQNVE